MATHHQSPSSQPRPDYPAPFTLSWQGQLPLADSPTNHCWPRSSRMHITSHFLLHPRKLPPSLAIPFMYSAACFNPSPQAPHPYPKHPFFGNADPVEQRWQAITVRAQAGTSGRAPPYQLLPYQLRPINCIRSHVPCTSKILSIQNQHATHTMQAGTCREHLRSLS